MNRLAVDFLTAIIMIVAVLIIASAWWGVSGGPIRRVHDRVLDSPGDHARTVPLDATTLRIEKKDPSHRAISILADEESAVMRHRRANGARPNRGVEPVMKSSAATS